MDKEDAVQRKTKLLNMCTIISAAVCLTLTAAQADVETTQEPNGATKTKIRVNGLFTWANLVDDTTGTNGFLNTSKDEITNTSAMDFAYATPTLDPNIVILIQGAGEISNSALTITPTSAHLVVATPFPVNRCEVNLNTGEFNCVTTTPITFDLTWTIDGFARIHEKTKREETLGPVTTKFHGEFDQRSAGITGTWDGHLATNMFGNLLDTQSTTVLREITLEPNP